MIPATDQEPIVEETTYVPDLGCPACGKAIYLDAQLYAFGLFDVRCDGCFALLGVKIGDEYYDRRAQTHYEAIRPRDGLTGGRLLETPVIKEPSVRVPQEFLQVFQHIRLPQDVRRRMEIVVAHFADGQYEASVAMGCRGAVQAALMDQGIPDAKITAMVHEARKVKLLNGYVAYCCEAVVTAGGESAHAAERPGGRREALATIAQTAVVLGRLYGLPR